ncbi:PIN domain-containing protein [Halorubrum ezzemoulense]|uniref:PIN domain-containing protein n=1 Tax=Halorubrum ezzemoulense TaxID=337243 RepID=UPI00211AC064|nr:PIN domain-containing protein [Halorubrum ezzemoulense]
MTRRSTSCSNASLRPRIRSTSARGARKPPTAHVTPSSARERVLSGDPPRYLRRHRHARRRPGHRQFVEDRGQPYLTSALCVFEVLNGKISAGTTDVVAIRQDFGGVQSLELNDQIALEATQIQDQLMDDGERMAARDLLIAATARSTGAELIVADFDFETRLLTDLMDVTNLRTHD